MKFHAPLLALVALSLAADSAWSQLTVTQRGRGPFSVYSHLHSMTSAAGNDENLLKPVGDQTAVPSAPALPLNPDPNTPVWRLDAMFDPADLPLIDIDGMSTGNDLIHVNPVTGQVDAAVGQAWAALTFSVTKDAVGATNSWVASRSSSSGGPGVGGDVLSYFFEDSVGIEPRLLGENFMEQRAEDMGHDPAGELDALDFFAPLLTMNGGSSAPVFFVNQDQFYFTVTSASAAALGPDFFDAGPPSGASILRMTWDPALGTNGDWTSPTVIRTPSDLDLIHPDTDEVDALGYNPAQGTVLFSTKVDANYPGRSQLQVHFPGAQNVLDVTRSTGGGTGSGPMYGGLRITDTDDIDAICGIDPESGNFSAFIGTPENHFSYGASKYISLSVSRDTESPGAPDYGVIQLSGWGEYVPTASKVTFYATEGLGFPIIELGSVPRFPQDDTVELTVPLPAVPTSTTTSFPGVTVRLIAVISVSGHKKYSITYIQTMRI